MVYQLKQFGLFVTALFCLSLFNILLPFRNWLKKKQTELEEEYPQLKR